MIKYQRDRPKSKQFEEIRALGDEAFSFQFEDSELLEKLIGGNQTVFSRPVHPLTMEHSGGKPDPESKLHYRVCSKAVLLIKFVHVYSVVTHVRSFIECKKDRTYRRMNGQFENNF